MKSQHLIVLGALVALPSCGPQQQPQQPARNSTAPVVPAPSAPPAVSNKPSPAPAPAPAPAPTVDPKSSEAALDLVRGLVDLLNRGKFDEAYMLLGPGAPPRTDFDRHFSAYSNLHVSIGNAGNQEGAAGSVYLSVPITISGVSNGKHEDRSATVILRRVNDVPGSTEAQRHWHVERIDWGSAA